MVCETLEEQKIASELICRFEVIPSQIVGSLNRIVLNRK